MEKELHFNESNINNETTTPRSYLISSSNNSHNNNNNNCVSSSSYGLDLTQNNSVHNEKTCDNENEQDEDEEEINNPNLKNGDDGDENRTVTSIFPASNKFSKVNK